MTEVWNGTCRLEPHPPRLQGINPRGWREGAAGADRGSGELGPESAGAGWAEARGRRRRPALSHRRTDLGSYLLGQLPPPAQSPPQAWPAPPPHLPHCPPHCPLTAARVLWGAGIPRERGEKNNVELGIVLMEIMLPGNHESWVKFCRNWDQPSRVCLHRGVKQLGTGLLRRPGQKAGQPLGKLPGLRAASTPAIPLPSASPGRL